MTKRGGLVILALVERTQTSRCLRRRGCQHHSHDCRHPWKEWWSNASSWLSLSRQHDPQRWHSGKPAVKRRAMVGAAPSRARPSPSSPLSTQCTHQILCHIAFTKRILDRSGRVAFYGPVGNGWGVAGPFRRRSFSGNIAKLIMVNVRLPWAAKPCPAKG